MEGINFVEKIEDITYIRVKDTEYGIQDVSSTFSSADEESKLLTKEEKLADFRKVIPSFEVFKNIVKENDGYLITDIFDIDMKYGSENEDCFYLERIAIQPKYWGAGIGSIIYSYIEQIVRDMGYKCIYIGAIGTWQIINFYKSQGFVPIRKIDADYIVPFLEQLNTRNIALTDETSDRYIMPMEKKLV